MEFFRLNLTFKNLLLKMKTGGNIWKGVGGNEKTTHNYVHFTNYYMKLKQIYIYLIECTNKIFEI